MPADRKQLPGVLLLVLSTLGVLLPALLAAGLLYWLSASEAFSAPSREHGGALSLASLALLMAGLNIPAVVITIRHLAGQPASQSPADWRHPQGFLLFALMIIVAAGIWASRQPESPTLLGALSLPVVGLPIIWLVSTARQGLPRVSALRGWGTLTVALTAAPAIILALELIFMGVAILSMLMALGFHPALLERLSALSNLPVNMPADMEALENSLFALARNPLVGGVMVATIGVAAPLIEELVKPLAVWLLARRQLQPADGYILGLISGGAFALLESTILVSQYASTSWLYAAALRAITAVLHIGLSGWVGYSIARAFHEKKPSHALLGLMGAIFLHGAWNIMALWSGFTASSLSPPSETLLDTAVTWLPLALMLAVLTAVLMINWFIKRTLLDEMKQLIP